MSTGYGWEGIRQVCETLLGARHVPERLRGGSVYLGRYNKCLSFTFTFYAKYETLNGVKLDVYNLTELFFLLLHIALSDFFVVGLLVKS